MTNEQPEKLAEVKAIGTMVVLQFCCPRCGLPGSALSYKHYSKSLQKVGVFCEDCRHHMPNSINIDLRQCPELNGKPIFPQGIVWQNQNPNSVA